MADIFDELIKGGVPPEALVQALREQRNLGVIGAASGSKVVGPMGQGLQEDALAQAASYRKRKDTNAQNAESNRLEEMRAKLVQEEARANRLQRASEGAADRALRRELAGANRAALADRDAAKAKLKAGAAAPQMDWEGYATELTGLADTAAKALKQTGRLSAGLFGHTSFIGGTPAADLKARITPLASNLALEKLKDLKAASKTGASGLGSVTEREIDLLINHIASLDQLQSPDQLRENIAMIEQRFRGLANKAGRAARGENLGETAFAGPQGAGGGLSQQLQDLIGDDEDLRMLLEDMQ